MQNPNPNSQLNGPNKNKDQNQNINNQPSINNLVSNPKIGENNPLNPTKQKRNSIIGAGQNNPTTITSNISTNPVTGNPIPGSNPNTIISNVATANNSTVISAFKTQTNPLLRQVNSATFITSTTTPPPSDNSLPSNTLTQNISYPPKSNNPSANPTNLLPATSSNPSNPSNLSNPNPTSPRVDQTLSFSFKPLIQCIIKSQPLSPHLINQLSLSYLRFMKNTQNPSLSLQDQILSKQQTFKTIQNNKQFIYKYRKLNNFPQINQLQPKSQLILTQYFTSIIQQTCNNLPFISGSACLQFLKLHIYSNPTIYLTSDNKIKLSLFSLKQFPIINNKITINRHTNLYINLTTQLTQLIQTNFKQLNFIFNQKIKLYENNQQSYSRIFKKYKQQQIKKSIINTTKSLKTLLQYTNQHTIFIKYINYLYYITQTILFLFMTYQQYFSDEFTQVLIRLFDRYYAVFNQVYQITKENKQIHLKNIKKYKKIQNSIQNIIVGIAKNMQKQNEINAKNNKSKTIKGDNNKNILNNNNIKRWRFSPYIKQIIQKSNLLILLPFKLILSLDQTYSISQTQLLTLYQFPISINFKPFIDTLIYSYPITQLTQQFIFNSILSISSQNYSSLWKYPKQFQSFYIFIKKINKLNKNVNKQEQVQFLQNVLKIAIKLMGKAQSQIDQEEKRKLNIIDQQYPYSQKYPFAENVYNKFLEYFLGYQTLRDKQQFYQIVMTELTQFIYLNKQGQTLNKQQQQQQHILKQYLLKLFLSQPLILDQITHITLPQSQITLQQILKYLIFSSLQNLHTPKHLQKLSISLISCLLLSSKFKHTISQLLLLSLCSPQELSLQHQQFSSQLQSLYTKQFQRIFHNIYQYLDINPFILQYLMNHTVFLIQNNYQYSIWCQELLKLFVKVSNQKKNVYQLKYYTRLVNKIIVKLNSDSIQDIRKVEKLKNYVNFGFIGDFIINCLKFEKNNDKHNNIILSQKSYSKSQILLQSIQLFNTILLYHLRSYTLPNSSFSQSKPSQTLFFSSPQPSSFYPLYLQKLLITSSPQQISSSTIQQSTSFINCLVFILLNSNKKQKQILKTINFNYENVIFECIENLIKLNEKNNKNDIKNMFIVYSANDLMPTQIVSIQDKYRQQKSYLNLFIMYIQKTFNLSGIQTLIFSNLLSLQKSQHLRLRKIIDIIKHKLQNPIILQKLSQKQTLKIISTLSRYFSNTLIQLYQSSILTQSYQSQLSTNMIMITLSSIDLCEHLQSIIQIILMILPRYFNNNNNEKYIQISLQHILHNIYTGFNLTQVINQKCYLKWMKNFYRLILNKFNLYYLYNQKHMQIHNQLQILSLSNNHNNQNNQNNQNPQHHLPHNLTHLNPQYFKLSLLFFNSYHYLSQQQFKQLITADKFNQYLENYIKIIIEQTQFYLLNKKNKDLIEIVLEILRSVLGMYVRIYQERLLQSNYIKLINYVYIIMKRKENQEMLKNYANYTLILLLIQSILKIKINMTQINFQNDYWYLRVNSINQNHININIFKKLIRTLKTPKLNPTFFISICKGISHIIQSNNQIQWIQQSLIDQIYSIFLHFSFNFSQNNHNNQSPYKIIWIQQLLLSILTMSQIQSQSQNNYYENNSLLLTQKLFEVFICQEDTMLIRLGYLMKKIAYYQNQKTIEWIKELECYIPFNYQKCTVTYAEKLECLTLMKIVNFVLANSNWNHNYIQRYLDIVKALVYFRKVFAVLPQSDKKPKAITVAEKKALQILLNKTSSKGQSQINIQMSSIIRPSGTMTSSRMLQSQNFNKSQNCFQLLHQLINLQLTCQYSLLCLSIPTPSHQHILSKNQHLCEIQNWLQTYLSLSQSLTTQYTSLLHHKVLAQSILTTFSTQFYSQSLPFMTQSLFLSLPSLSTHLTCSYPEVVQLIQSTLHFLIDTSHELFLLLQQRIQISIFGQFERFKNIIKSIKRYDKNQNWLNYSLIDGNDKATMTRTIKTQISQSIIKTRK